jgi:hypothetical protein
MDESVDVLDSVDDPQMGIMSSSVRSTGPPRGGRPDVVIEEG